jgi:ribose 5-phosphate isomerase A
MNAKQQAADAALEYVQSDMVIGLGTGSTADCFIRSLGVALKSGRLRNVRGVPTSIASDRLARQLNIPIVALSEHPQLDVAIDGADEIDPQLNLIKGLGGALLREKIIAQSAAKMIVIADDSKLVPVLGSKSPLPVEVAAFSHEIHVEHFRKLGADPTLRRTDDGSIFETDNGNYIYDCRFARIEDPASLHAAIRAWAGVVDTGLFIHIAAMALVGSPAGVKTVSR